MDKNRRDRIRKIVIDDIRYNWLVSNYNCDGDCNYSVTIWNSDGLKLYSELHGNQTISPKIIKNIIAELNNG